MKEQKSLGLKYRSDYYVLFIFSGDYLCTLCNTQLLTVGSVKKHIKNDHFGFTPFQCPACQKMIQQKSHLKTHIEKQHPGKKGLLKKALANHNKVKILDREVDSN